MINTQPTSQWHPTPATQNPLYPMTQPVQVIQPNFQPAPQTEYYFPPLQQTTPVHGTHLTNQHNNRQTQRMTSSSEEEEERSPTNSSNWQVVKSVKRKKTLKSVHDTNAVTTNNRYESLAMEEHTPPDNNDNPTPAREPKPPPIFVHGVVNYREMVKQIHVLVENEQYYTKSLANNVVKINCNTSDTYRKLVREFKEKNIYHHTYQLKEERAYRIVIRYLHYSTDTEDIREELLRLGHKARNIINVRNRLTEEPLNMFFVDLDPASNNKEVYNIKGLKNKIIEIEPPRTTKKII